MTPWWKGNPHVGDWGDFWDKQMEDPEFRRLFEIRHAQTCAAQAVYEARKKAALTQAALAKGAGTSQSAIARLEGNRDSRVPTVDLLARIAHACGARLKVEFDFSPPKKEKHA